MRKRIGILLAQLEENTQKRFTDAFIKEAYAHDYDVCVFSMYQKYQETELRNIGDSNIFSLIRLECFDGIVVMLDTLLNPGLDAKILKRLKEEYNGPVIIADRECDMFDYVLIDHYSPVFKLVSHLIEVHGFTDIAFLGGKKGHPHSIQRLNGYLDAMKIHGLKIREDRIRHGNYWYDSGHAFVDDLVKNKDDMPQAIACANDPMAIGVAARLSSYGYKIPDDIAVIGYDSTIEGRTSPVPLTSADIPAASCGRQCFNYIHSKITGRSDDHVALDAKILIGGSCGCRDFTPVFKNMNREEWKTDRSEVSYYSDFNHITEDMLCQTNFKKFFNLLTTYSYQIRPFENFYMCLNNDFLNASSFIGENALRYGYTDTMNMVISCGPTIESNNEAVNLNKSFETKQMIPALFEDRDHPAVFIFSPMFFEDRCFGYVVLNPGKDLSSYTKTFRAWMRSVNLGLEAFYRQKALTGFIDRIKSDQVRDVKTGLYNYQGFLEKLTLMTNMNKGLSRSVGVMALDFEDLKHINEKYTISVGDSAINALSMIVANSTMDDEVCGHLGADEFLIGIVSDDCKARFDEIIASLPKQGVAYTDNDKITHYTSIFHSELQNAIKDLQGLDFLINQTVNAKNHKKKMDRMSRLAIKDMSAEDQSRCNDVDRLLNESLITYHFQPIVRADDGEIFGYEALMRPIDGINLTPLEIISCASKLNRLYDVEKATFDRVLTHISENSALFEDKKVFINSLPAYQLEGNDEAILYKRLNDHSGQIVVEYTEASEFAEEKLEKRKSDYDKLKVEIALDDYGSGYSNVNNLIRYTPKYVKIDRMLVSGINASEQKKHFVKSIVDYASKNNITVLAEGVETKEEMRCVISLGVDLIQGYYTGRPCAEPISAIDEEVRFQIRRYNYNRDDSFIEF